MSKELFVRAEEVARGTGYLQALRLQTGAGDERRTETKGFITIPGRVSRRYFEEKFYGLRDGQ